eukprot:gene20782-40670_t
MLLISGAGACFGLESAVSLATRTTSPSFKKPAPRTATVALASSPVVISTRSATR